MTGPGASPRSADRGRVILSMMTLGFGPADNMFFIFFIYSLRRARVNENPGGADMPRDGEDEYVSRAGLIPAGVSMCPGPG